MRIRSLRAPIGARWTGGDLRARGDLRSGDQPDRCRFGKEIFDEQRLCFYESAMPIVERLYVPGELLVAGFRFNINRVVSRHRKIIYAYDQKH